MSHCLPGGLAVSRASTTNSTAKSRSTSLYNAGASSRGGCRAVQLYSALQLYSSTALYTLHPLHPPSAQFRSPRGVFWPLEFIKLSSRKNDSSDAHSDHLPPCHVIAQVHSVFDHLRLYGRRRHRGSLRICRDSRRRVHHCKRKKENRQPKGGMGSPLRGFLRESRILFL